MKLERIYVGQISLNTGEVDVTDPCYDKDVWCRTHFSIKPGTYNCYSYVGIDPMWGQRVWINQIVIADGEDAVFAEDRIHSGRSWRRVGEIGVDAGLAGFFDNKPDFGDDEWHDLCDWMHKSDDCNPEGIYDTYLKSFDGRDGFWTSSGCGDGCYSVHAIRNNGKIVALEVRF